MSYVSAETVSSLAVELLARTIVLPATVTKVPASDYAGSGGTTIVRVPQRRTATAVSGPLTYGAIDETPVEVTVARWYDGVKVDVDESTLDIVEFGRQVIAPMTAGIAEAGEKVLADVMNAVAPADQFQDLTDPDATRADVLAIREALTRNDVPQANRFLSCAPDVITGMLLVPDFVRANEAATTEALREATIGRIFGMTVVESNSLSDTSAVGYHRSGFAFATLAPALPQAGNGASANSSGIAARVVFAYDTSTGGDVVLIDTYGGAVLIDATRVVRYGEEESS